MADPSLTIRYLLQSLYEAGETNLQIYTEKADEGRINPLTGVMSKGFKKFFRDQPELKDLGASIYLAEFMSRKLIYEDRDPKKFLSIDTTLPASLQLLQILKDLQQAIKGPIDKIFAAEILSILKSYPDLENFYENTNNKNLHEYLVIVINQMSASLNEEIAQYNKRPKHKDYERFHENSVLEEKDASGMFTHDTNIVRKNLKPNESPLQKHAVDWFAKFVPDKRLALMEVIAQEFFRLIIPYQPKTRMTKNKDGDIFVLSKKVDGVSMETLRQEDLADLKSKIISGEYKGLGKIMPICLILQEVDLKPGNVLLDSTGNFVKIDGDWCMASQRDRSYSADYKIKAKDISQLPFVETFQPYNWLDIFKAGTFSADKYGMNGSNYLFDGDFQHNPDFRREINESILKMLLIPAPILMRFTDRYGSNINEMQNLQDLLGERLNMLIDEAMKEKSFREYLTSDAAKEFFTASFKEFLNFKTKGKENLVSIRDYKDFSKRFEILRTYAVEVADFENAKLNPPAVTATEEKKPEPIKSSRKFLPALKMKNNVKDAPVILTLEDKNPQTPERFPVAGNGKIAQAIKWFKSAKLEPIINEKKIENTVPIKKLKKY